jgi:proline dehydrogenase
MKLGQAVVGKKMFALLMKKTFYGQFVAGEDRHSIKPSIHRMHSFGVKSILDYSVEEDISAVQAEELEMKYYPGDLNCSSVLFQQSF